MRHKPTNLVITPVTYRSGRGCRASWRRIALGLTLLFIPGCTMGEALRSTCAPYEAIKRRNMTKWVATKEAKRIWRDCYANQFQAQPYKEDVKEGFVLAYVETALGGNGCPPPVPVSPVLGKHTLTHTFPNGNQWFYGYHLGHANALSHGVERRRFAPLNPELMCIPSSVSTHGCIDDAVATPCEANYLDSGPLALEHLMESDEFNQTIVGSVIGTENQSIVAANADAGDQGVESPVEPELDAPPPSDSSSNPSEDESGLVSQSLTELHGKLHPVVIDNPASLN